MKKEEKLINFGEETIEIPIDFIYKKGDVSFSWRDKMVYLFILAFKQAEGKDPSRHDFNSYSGTSLNVIRDTINKFKNLGMMEVKHRKNRTGKGFKPNEHTLKAW